MTVTELNNTAIKYRKQLLLLPIIALRHSLQHMTLRTGIQYEEAVGSLLAELEIRPHTGDVNVQDGPEIVIRKIRTWVGDVILEEALEDLRSTIIGKQLGEFGLLGKNKDMNKHPLEKQIIALIASKVGQKLNQHLFNAVRNDTGTTTAALFNGFDTITTADISNGNIAAAKNNLVTSIGTIDETNAYSKLNDFFLSADDNLKLVPTKLFVSANIATAYNRSAKDELGSVVYNRQLQKTFLEESNEMCEIVPLIGKANSNFIHLTTKDNMLVGVDQDSDREYVKVREIDNPFKTQFVLKMNFGVQLERVDSELLLVGQLV